MKRYGNLFKHVCSMENLLLAHRNARKGKGWYTEVKAVDADTDTYLKRLQDTLLTHTYRTSHYETFTKAEHGKVREIYKLPYFPDRICQWALMQVIEPYLLKHVTRDTYSAIAGRGIHEALKQVKKAIRQDKENCRFCLKMDIHHYYQSINHERLKEMFRRIFKDPELLWLIDEIIDSISTITEEDLRENKNATPQTGVPIGNFLSQWCGNLYLSEFTRWLKEAKRVKHCFLYMDDIVIFSSSKETLHALQKDCFRYLSEDLKLSVKGNWQIFPTYVRGLDFIGYRVFSAYTLLRKSTYKEMRRKMTAIRAKTDKGCLMSHSEWCSVNSYKGWLKHCDSWRLSKKYIAPLKVGTDRYYHEVIETNKKGRKQDERPRDCV